MVCEYAQAILAPEEIGGQKTRRRCKPWQKYIINPNFTEEQTAAVVEKFKALVEAHGTLDELEEMGKRKLAYEINYISEGYYVLMKFTSGADFPAELDRILGITDGIMRRLITLRAE